ncbi:MAG: 4Fe-4S dicluster domain-containing protein [Thermoanaerobaculia bacterium]
MTTDRRGFFLLAGKYLIVTAAAAEILPKLLEGAVPDLPAYRVADHWWAMTIDIEKCIGCGNCVRACKAENDVPRDAASFRTWVERYHVREGDIEHPDVDSPNGGFDGFPEKYAVGDGARSFFVPKLCNHCAHSPCVQVCPVGATFVSPDGVVLVDKKYCLGCRYCVQACPYGCRFIDSRTNTADKCTLCYHRITKGLLPACVESCPTATRQLGDLKNPDDPIHAFLREHKIQVLKPHMATGSKAYYNGLDGSVR